MTKTNQAILTALLTNTELALHEDFITQILDQAGKKGPKEAANPDYTDDSTGIEMKWCTRHEQYEPKSGWKVGKGGRMDQSCDVAVAQWRLLTKELKSMTKELLETGDEDLRIATKAKSDERSGKFTPEYTTEELLEMAAPSKPTRTKK